MAAGRIDVKKKASLLVLSLCLLAGLVSASSADIIKSTDKQLFWESPKYANCDPVSGACFIDFNFTNIYTASLSFKESDMNAASTNIFYKLSSIEMQYAIQVARIRPIYGYVDSTYVCKDKIGTYGVGKYFYCYLDNGKNQTILFDQTYTNYEPLTQTFTYSEYVQKGTETYYETTYASGNKYISKPIGVNEIKRYRLNFKVPLPSSGKFDINLCYTKDGVKECSTLDPYWTAGNTLYRRQNYGMTQTTLVYPLNGTSTIYLHNGSAMLYGQNCSVGTNKSIYTHYNSTSAIAGVYNTTPTKCAWGSTYPSQIDLSSAVTNLTSYYPLDEASGTTAYDLVGTTDGTNSGAVVNTAGKIWKSYDLERDDSDYVKLGSEQWQYATFSVSFWVKQESTSADYYIAISNLQDYRYGWKLGIYNTRAIFETTGASGIVDSAYSPVGSTAAGNWYHIVGVRNGTTSMKIYLNGVLNGSDITLSAIAYTGTQIGYIGRQNYTNVYYFDGLVDDVQIWDKALSQAEVTALYNLGTTVGAETTIYEICGDNITEGNEQCDGEICCSDTCTFNSSNDVCRIMGGICDSEELCTGSDADCPADLIEPNTTVCRASTEYCDPAEACNGIDITCPTDISNCTANLTITWGQRWACTNSNFTLWAIYGNLTDANVTATLNGITYNLTYNSTTHRYEGIFTSNIEQVVSVLINASRINYPTETITSFMTIITCFNLNVRLWEQVDLQTIYQTNNTIITDTNYNKQLVDPYINDFAWIIAKNNDHNATGEYRYCNIPIGSVQGFLSPIASLLGNNLTNLLTNDIKNLTGCSDYWFRADYRNGSANLTLPWKGNYSIYLLDGIATWENQYSPPKIARSNLFISLGEADLPDKLNSTLDYWLPHSEIDFWASITDSAFIFFVSILPIIAFVGMLLLGFPIQLAGLIFIFIESTWLITGVLHWL